MSPSRGVVSAAWRRVNFMDIKEIESAIARLPPSQVAQLAEWFAEFQARVWDAQLEQDVRGGRLDSLIEQAEQDFEGGRCEPL